jgi:hypothetical protein
MDKHRGRIQNVAQSIPAVCTFIHAINSSNSLQKKKGSDFAEQLRELLNVTDGWLMRWKERHGIVIYD